MFKKNDIKIDMVYCWVDGNDPVWLEKKNRFLGEVVEESSNFACRFIDNDELKYSLRSVEKYASWINHIFIITDNQVPSWLNINNPKISVVDHKDIMPPSSLPTFNSLAIEYCMHKIPDLSEYFLYANDDMLFVDYVKPDFFFKNNKQFYCRFEKTIENEPNSHYMEKLKNAVKILQQKNYKFPLYIPHHNIDACRKSVIEDCQREFFDEINKTINDKFRSSTHVQRALYSYYAIAQKSGIFVKVQEYSELLPFYKRLIAKMKEKRCKDSLFIYGNPARTQNRINKFHPKLLCINDGEITTDEYRKTAKLFLETYFNKKSSFEI